MSKKSLTIGGAAVALLLIVYVVLDFFLGSIVTAGVNRFAPGMVRTDVNLAGAHISPLTGSGTLTGLSVGNPKGWSSNRALYLGRIHVDVAPFSIFGDHIVINEIVIDQPEFLYETKIVSSNIGDLLKGIKGSADTGGAAPTTKAGKPIKFEVKRFRLNNGLVKLGIGPTAVSLPMPPLAFDDLGVAEGGITADQLAFAVMRSMASGVVSATTQAAGKVGSTMGAAAGDSAKKATDALKGLFGGNGNKN